MAITSEKQYKLLLIDDDETDRKMFRRCLKQSKISFDIHECAQAQSGIDNFHDNQFDFVFLDYQLPDANGLQVLETVLKEDPSAQIIMLTGMGDESLAVASMKAGASDYISKDSLSSSILLRCLETLDLKQAKETAEKSNQAKSEFLSKMSHELRTPLNAILGFAQLMNESKSNPLPPIHQKRSQQILIAGKHLLNLINEVLELSKIESGEIPVSLESVSIADEIKSALDEVFFLAKTHKVLLTNNTNSQENLTIQGDKTRLKQVLLNIITNAIKYNIENGEVTLDCECLDSNTLQINIKDTGIGIAEDKLSRLFNPFDRLGAENSNIEGVGIGLTISKKLISLMKGTLEVSSKVDQGSHFYIRLPLISNNKNIVNTEEDSNDINFHKKHRILYVEDNLANLELVEDIFSEYSNIQIISAPNGKVGVDEAETNLPDLILMDINMPEMDGFEALMLLKKNPSTQNIPVIALSANAMQQDIDQAMEAGFNSYITKPINIAKLKNKIKEFLYEF